MAELDFTALSKLAYRGFETVEEQEKKDALIEQGFTIAEDDKDNPFLKDAPTASQTALEPPPASALTKPSTTPENASEGRIEAVMSALDEQDGTQPLNPPAKVEVKQIFSLQDIEPLCNLYRDGRIQLLEKIHIFKKSGAVYAHFMLVLDEEGGYNKTATKPQQNEPF